MAVVDHNQSLFDLAVQHLGSAAGVFQLALLNGLSITDDIKAGTELITGEVIDSNIVRYFANGGYIPASALTKSDNEIQLSGIDYWAVSVDFIVS